VLLGDEEFGALRATTAPGDDRLGVGPAVDPGYDDRIRRAARENANQLSARGEKFE
jgi:hypothetical protein